MGLRYLGLDDRAPEMRQRYVFEERRGRHGAQQIGFREGRAAMRAFGGGFDDLVELAFREARYQLLDRDALDDIAVREEPVRQRAVDHEGHVLLGALVVVLLAHRDGP